jgi:hypothetical protein
MDTVWAPAIKSVFVLPRPTPGIFSTPYGHPSGISVCEGKPPTLINKISKIFEFQPLFSLLIPNTVSFRGKGSLVLF